MPEVVLELDDYAVSNIPFDTLVPLKEHFPGLKVTLFYIPFDRNLETRATMDKLLEFSEMTRKFDWIEIAVHGFAHDWDEFNVDYKKADALLKGAENMLTRFNFMENRSWIWWGPKWLRKRKRSMDVNIPYKKIFRAPRWQMSTDAYKLLRDRGYAVATDRNQPRPDIPDMIQYRYNWSIEEPFPQDYKVVKGHGHIFANMANDVHSCYQNLLKMPTDTKFLFVSEYLEKYGSD